MSTSSNSSPDRCSIASDETLVNTDDGYSDQNNNTSNTTRASNRSIQLTPGNDTPSRQSIMPPHERVTPREQISIEITTLREAAKAKSVHLVAINRRIRELEAMSRDLGQQGEDGQSGDVGDEAGDFENGEEVIDVGLLRFFPSRNYH